MGRTISDIKVFRVITTTFKRKYDKLVPGLNKINLFWISK